MADEDLDRRLDAYLKDQERANGWRDRLSSDVSEIKASAQRTESEVKAIAQRQAEHELHDERRHGEIVARVSVNATRIDANARRIDDMAEAEDITEITNIQELREKARSLKSERDDARKALATSDRARVNTLTRLVLYLLGGAGVGAGALKGIEALLQ